MTKVYDIHGNVLVAMYRQFDGYPQSHGKDLAAFLASGRLVNGLSGDTERLRRLRTCGMVGNSGISRAFTVFNGASCLAAQMVSEFKTEPGGIYLYPTDCYGEEWNYNVRVDRLGQRVDPVTISVSAYGKEQFKGTRSEFVAFCANPPEDTEE